MEDRPSFYDFLTANSKISKKEEKKIHPIYMIVSWLIILFTNSGLLYVAWNYSVVHIFGFNPVTFVQAILLYIAAKILTRGLFSVE